MLIIVDIDTTLADCSHRLHLIECETPDWNKFLSPELLALDIPTEGSIEGLRILREKGNTVVFLTGRNEGLREATAAWVKKHYGIDTVPNPPDIRGNRPECTLIMRPLGDQRMPTDYKRAELNKMVYWGQFGGWIALDDDPYMQAIYSEYYAIPLLAPDCWKIMYHFRKDLPEETNWRK